MKANWPEYPNFSKQEFDCRHTGLNEMQHEFMQKLQALRTEFDRPLRITSGYRHPSHPVERVKGHSRGEHTKGLCADVACVDSATRYRLVALAYKHGFTRIGIAKNFLHLGIGGEGLPNHVMWDYQ